MTAPRGTGATPIENLHEHVVSRLAIDEQRYTAGRRRLVEALADQAQPVTLPDLIASAPELAPSSAYRNLDVLERCGVILRITGSGDHAHFELAESLLGHHHHLICLGCGIVVDMHLDGELESLVELRLAAAAASAGFAPIRHSLDLYGHCESCRTEADSPAAAV